MEIIPKTEKKSACQFDYEFMGRTIEDLASRYGFPEALLEQAVKMENWQRRLQPIPLPKEADCASLEEYASKLRSVATDQLMVADILRQIDQLPTLASIETTILDKCQATLKNLDPDEPKAATTLKNLLSIVNDIRQANPIVTAIANGDEDGNGKLVVNIQNNVGE